MAETAADHPELRGSVWFQPLGDTGWDQQVVVTTSCCYCKVTKSANPPYSITEARPLV